MKTLEDVLPPPPHKMLKEAAEDVRGLADNLRQDVTGVADDVRVTVVELAPHNILRGMPKPPKPDGRELLPPKPPSPPKPPRLGD